MSQAAEIAGQIVNRNEMAGILGCAPQTLERHVAAGCPILERGKTKNGHKYNTADVIRWVEARKAQKSGPTGTQSEARHRFTLAAAELKELQLAEKRGTMIAVADVTQLLGEELSSMRTRLMEMPGRLAARLEGQTGIEIERLIDEEVQGALNEISTGVHA